LVLYWLQCIPQYLKWELPFNAIYSFFLTLFLVINSSKVHANSFYEYFVNQQKIKHDDLGKNSNIRVSNFYNIDLIISSTPSIKFYTEILEEEGLPIDLAVIPLIESGNNPQARSPKNALGLWQFIPSTAKEWGLASNKADNRKNVIKSTRIAIKYLKYLHNQLNDWNLTLAAYNWGIGSVKKALKKGLVTNKIINLRKLPLETRKYLVAFHHLNRIITINKSNAKLNKFPNVKYFVSVKQQNISNYISSENLKDIDNSVLKHINGYDVFDKDNKGSEVLLPSKEFQEYFSIKEISYKKSLSKKSCPKKYYKAKYRDTLVKLAKRYNIKMDLLKEMNPQISFLRPGMNVKLCK